MKKRKLLTVISAVAAISAFTMTSYAGQWKQDSKGWWYENDDGSYLKDTMQIIDGETYSFDTDGYIDIGWHQKADGWYWFNESGVMQKSKELEGGHLDENGKLIFDDWTLYRDERGWGDKEHPEYSGKLVYHVYTYSQETQIVPDSDSIKVYFGSAERTQLAKTLADQIAGAKGTDYKKYELTSQLPDNWLELYPLPFIVQIANAVFTDRWARVGNDGFVFERASIDDNKVLHLNVEYVMGEAMEGFFTAEHPNYPIR